MPTDDSRHTLRSLPVASATPVQGTRSKLRKPINFNLLSHTVILYMTRDDVIVQYIIYVRTW